jgi:putative endopeptidase
MTAVLHLPMAKSRSFPLRTTKDFLVNRYLLSTLTLSLMAAFVPAGAADSGIDMQYIDSSVRVQDDFFTYLNGKWLKTAEIPAGQARAGAPS